MSYELWTSCLIGKAHVMDRGTGERALKLKPVAHVGHGDDGVGDRRA